MKIRKTSKIVDMIRVKVGESDALAPKSPHHLGADNLHVQWKPKCSSLSPKIKRHRIYRSVFDKTLSISWHYPTTNYQSRRKKVYFQRVEWKWKKRESGRLFQFSRGALSMILVPLLSYCLFSFNSLTSSFSWAPALKIDCRANF